ncbi:MAG: GNAT family N-acetyltransferase [Verrucomicrobiales bacterium]
MQRCIEAAILRGVGRITLEVAKTNKAAGSLYERVGFRATGEAGEFLMMDCVLPLRHEPGQA